MRFHTRLIAAAVAATALFAAVAGSASANSLSISHRHIQAVWAGSAEQKLHFFSSGIGARCNVTLGGSFTQETITKTLGLLVGVITSANLEGCEFEGGASAVSILRPSEASPWRITYEVFFGRLPNITGVKILLVGAAFLLTAFGVSCLYRSTVEESANGIANLDGEGNVTSLSAEAETEIPLSSGIFLCPESGKFEGSAAVTETENGGTSAVLIRLI